LLRAIGASWAKDGHDVTVLSTQPSYKPELASSRRPRREDLDGMSVIRYGVFQERGRNTLLRAINNAWYSFRVFVHIVFSQRYDLVMVSTFPPILLAFLAAVGTRLRRAGFVYHCMDLHPEVMRLAGAVTNRQIFRMLCAVDRWTCRQASAVIVLSDDMRRTLESRDRGSIGTNIFVLNNFELPDYETARCKGSVFQFSKRKLSLIFAGNLGRFQGLDSIVDAISRVRGVELVFVGEGAAKKDLVKRIQEEQIEDVHFIGHQSAAVAKELMRRADLGIVSLNTGVFRVAYPSKTMTYLACGCPVLALVEPESELARKIRENELGYTVALGDSDALVPVLEETVHDRGNLDRMRAASVAYASENFGYDVVMAKWRRLLTDIAVDTA
jgi:glycosyltransferase involved in cell wall biosynthesis